MSEAKTTFKPIDKVFISIDKPLTDEIITEGGLKLYLDPSYNSHNHATVIGKVVALPLKSNEHNADIIKSLKVGDEIAFNYKVVIDKKITPKTDKFDSVVNERAYKEFVNQKGEKIIMRSLPYKNVLHWIGMLLDRKGVRIDGIQGKEKEVERWLTQFNFSESSTFLYNNLISIDDVDIWKCDPLHIYAKKSADGSIQTVGDRVIMKEIKIDITERVKLMNNVAIPDSRVITELVDRAFVVSAPEKSIINKGDLVFFDPIYVERYSFFGHEYLVIKQRRIHSIENKTN